MSLTHVDWAALQSEVEQFLFREARLIDERQFSEWVSLFTDDCRYWMPVRTTRLPRNSKSVVILDKANYREDELARDGEMAHFDDDKSTLLMRVNRLETGMAWAEDPPSRTRHLVTNVEIIEELGDDRYSVFSNFLTYRHRLEREVDIFVGRREDVLLCGETGWRIASRKIVLDQNVVSAKNLSIFF